MQMLIQLRNFVLNKILVNSEKRTYTAFIAWIRGAIGKEFVIKHYRYGVVKTKFPDMTRIIASIQQRKFQDLFREAVAYAKTVMADPVKKKDWEKKVRIKYRVFNRVIKEYMLAAKESILQKQKLVCRIIRSCFKPDDRNNNTNGIELLPILNPLIQYYVETG